MSEITIFAKKRTSTDGRSFYTYISRIPTKTGEEKVVSVAFTDDAGKPDPSKCPMNIEFDKSDANMSKKKVVSEDGSEAEFFTLWLSKWNEGTAYEDHSLDEFDI